MNLTLQALKVLVTKTAILSRNSVNALNINNFLKSLFHNIDIGDAKGNAWLNKGTNIVETSEGINITLSTDLKSKLLALNTFDKMTADLLCENIGLLGKK